MLALYAIVRTDLGPDVIVETYPTAEGARLFMERQDDGTQTPFRVAVLSERKTAKAPKMLVCNVVPGGGKGAAALAKASV